VRWVPLAINLSARLSLDGSPYLNELRRIQTQTQRMNIVTGTLRASTAALSRSFNAVTNPIRNLTNSVLGLAGAYASVQGAKKIFESTVGEAAKYEQSTVMISAMLNDKQLGKDYMKLVDRFAVDSPILDSQGMLANSKSFLTASKDMKQLEKMWSLAERMAAIDPYQGLEGAVFSLRELFSGDAISMVRRFEMPRAVMNDIKNMKLDDQLKALDKYFNSIGMTQKLIDEMGGTTLGVWAQIKEATNVVMRDIGAPALMKIKTFIQGIRTGMYSVKDVIKDRNLFTPEEFQERMNRAMSFEKFKETGAKILENISTGFLNAATGIGKWVESISNNPEFQKLTTLQSKVAFVFDDVWGTFKKWLDGDGQIQINKVTKDILEVMATGLIASQDIIITAATTIGKSVGSAMVSSASDSFANWQNQKMNDSKLYNTWWLPGFSAIKHLNNWGMGLREKFNSKESNPPKKNGGLSRVPYNGATYSLHKDEMILPRGEAAEYRNGNGGSGKPFSINIAKMEVRQESDIQKVAHELARLIEMEGVRMA